MIVLPVDAAPLVIFALLGLFAGVLVDVVLAGINETDSGVGI